MANGLEPYSLKDPFLPLDGKREGQRNTDHPLEAGQLQVEVLLSGKSSDAAAATIRLSGSREVNWIPPPKKNPSH